MRARSCDICERKIGNDEGVCWHRCAPHGGLSFLEWTAEDSAAGPAITFLEWNAEDSAGYTFLDSLATAHSRLARHRAREQARRMVQRAVVRALVRRRGAARRHRSAIRTTTRSTGSRTAGGGDPPDPPPSADALGGLAAPPDLAHELAADLLARPFERHLAPFGPLVGFGRQLYHRDLDHPGDHHRAHHGSAGASPWR
jgi:hypothetical protein